MEDGTTTTATYSYNADGQRIKKVVGSTTTNYYYNGDILAGMIIGSNKLIFMYDENGSPFGFTYNGTVYYYIKNLQGDVIAITNASGTVVVEYAYDAWGKLLSVSGTMASSIGQYNPIRYRGYVYDTETGYYYLQSRYYSPDLCRFISSDTYVSTGTGMLGFNMFSYCNGNPILFEDSTGCAPFPTTVAMSDCSSGTNLEGRLGSYKELRKLTAGNSDYEVHHLVEKRFYHTPGIGKYKDTPNDAPSVILRKANHKEYTITARARFPYGSNYSLMSAPTIKQFYLAEYGGKMDWLDFMCSCFE